jgi:biopolymer transport protein ExbD
VPKVQPAVEHGGGRGRARRVSTTLNEINVVPLVDVMLVLLIIFMVTAPMMQRGVDVNLPVARRAQATQGQRLFVSVPAAFHKDHLVYLNEEPIRFEILQERVRQAMETATQKDVYLRADATLSVQDILTVMDKLKDAGVEHVGIVANMPGERPGA